MTQLRTVRGLIVCVCLSWASVGNADVVVDWNVITAQTIAAGARPGPSPLFDYAMVHSAMHDAVQAFDGRFEPYNVAIPNASGSPVAAAAAAAHGVLVGLFPLQEGSLNTIFNNYLMAQGLSGDPGVAVGEQAALGILNMRMDDGRFPSNPEPFFGGTGPGEWRPTSFAGSPSSPVPMVTPWLGQVRPFTLKDSAQFRAGPPPPHLTSGAYVKAYDEVKALGALVNSTRTQAQTDIAVFYNDNSIVYWNRTLQTIADTLSQRRWRQCPALRPGQPGDGRRRASPPGTARRTGISGAPSQPFRKATTTGTRGRKATPSGCRSSPHRTIRTTRRAQTISPARQPACWRISLGRTR